MTITIPSYASPTLIAKMIPQSFMNQSPLTKTSNRSYAKMLGQNNLTSVGTTFQVPLDNRFSLQRGDTVVSESIVDRTVPCTVQPAYRTSVNYTTTAQKLLIRDLQKQTIDPLALTLATGIETDLVSLYEFNAYNTIDLTTSYDNAATGKLDSEEKLLKATTLMRALGIPENVNWYAALTPENHASVASSFLNRFTPIANNGILKDDIHAIGRCASLDVMYSQNLYSHISGTAGGATGVSVKTAVGSGNTVVLQGLTNGLTLVPGDRITFVGVKKINVRSLRDTSYDFTATVLTGGTVASTEVSITITPTINATSGDPNRNLNAAIPANTVVRIMKSHQLNLFYHENATLFVPIDQQDFDVAANQKGQYRDSETGLAFRVTKFPSPSTNQNVVYLDALTSMGLASDICGVIATDIISS